MDEDSYNSLKGADEYINFIESENGQIEQRVLWGAISARLNSHDGENILDAGCGQGWLTGKLAEKFSHATGCDASSYLIQFAQLNYPKAKFTVCDIGKQLP